LLIEGLSPDVLNLSAGILVLLIGLLAARTGLRIVEAQKSMMLAQIKLTEIIGQLSTGFQGVDARLDSLNDRTGAVEHSLEAGRRELVALPELLTGPLKALLHKLNGLGHVILEGNRTQIQMKLRQMNMLTMVEQHGRQLARLIDMAQSTNEDELMTRLIEIRDMLDARLPTSIPPPGPLHCNGEDSDEGAGSAEEKAAAASETAQEAAPDGVAL
jgi:hypothetical protein